MSATDNAVRSTYIWRRMHMYTAQKQGRAMAVLDLSVNPLSGVTIKIKCKVLIMMKSVPFA